MIGLDPASLSGHEMHKLLIGSVVPRPIALVTTLSAAGTLNAAPYSYFNIVSSHPPLLSISVQRKNGLRKDTSRNAEETGELVVHVADESYISQINETAAGLPPDESEVVLARLTAAPSLRVAVPGVAEASIRMECVLERSIPLGGDEHTAACDLLIGRVVYFHLSDKVYDGSYIDAAALKPVSRLAGQAYAKLGETFSLERPL
ncbi:flavin reductase family protein [Paenibacillaceae bacterium WGS1546]|uniref:flavin reductase family protein n=1 Tax=Cohnella sp. WGS1546 TaxID=3366810 RepID=UPI00372CF422